MAGLFQKKLPTLPASDRNPIPGTAGEYIVNILVYKENTQNFAKIEENVPEGYTAVALDAKDAIFTFKSQKVKFLWMNLPVDPYFTVSYRLIPRNKANLPPPSINGAFSYLIEEKTISVPVSERDIQLASLSESDINQIVTLALSEPVPGITGPPDLETNADQDAQANVALNDKKTVKPAKSIGQKREKQAETEVSLLLEPEQGVYYRIQLAAGHKPVNIERYFRRLKLEKEIRKEVA